MTKGEAQTIADTTFQQMGGGRLVAMTGAQVSHRGGILVLRLKRGSTANKATHCEIRLDPSDTYTMTFHRRWYRSGKFGEAEVSQHGDLYSDMLQDAFTYETGLYTKL